MNTVGVVIVLDFVIHAMCTIYPHTLTLRSETKPALSDFIFIARLGYGDIHQLLHTFW